MLAAPFLRAYKPRHDASYGDHYSNYMPGALSNRAAGIRRLSFRAAPHSDHTTRIPKDVRNVR